MSIVIVELVFKSIDRSPQVSHRRTLENQLGHILALLAAAAPYTTAAPTAEAETALDTRAVDSMMAKGSTWTIQNFKRVCNAANTQCSFTYSINTNDGSKATTCKYKSNGNPASHASYNSVKCGAFTIGSTWSDQFGLDKAFTTLSVVKSNLIVYPSYTDAQLKGNKVVKPDQSYTPQTLPS